MSFGDSVADFLVALKSTLDVNSVSTHSISFTVHDSTYKFIVEFFEPSSGGTNLMVYIQGLNADPAAGNVGWGKLELVAKSETAFKELWRVALARLQQLDGVGNQCQPLRPVLKIQTHA